MNTQELVSLPDIARLANVQRPVVSVWRTRSRGTAFPFPESKLKNGAQELFASEEIIEWLQATGRGNNPEFKEDSAAHATLARENFSLITALLALQQFLGQPLAQFSSIELLDAADELDPDDDFIYSEIDAAQDDLAFIVDYVDKLVDASYGALPAFESLFKDRFRANETALSRTALSESARRLVAKCAIELSVPDTTFHEASSNGSDLIYTLMQLVDESTTLQIQLPKGIKTEQTESRLTTRRLKMLVASNESFMFSTQPAAARPVVHLAQFPAPGKLDDDPLAILHAIDDLVLELNPNQSAIVIAPASVLVNATENKEVTNIRASILRMGRVRAAALLPQGHFLFKPRTALGLWVIGQEDSSIPLAERRIMLADLSELPLEDSVSDDFVADLAASLMDHHGIRAHSFRFAQWGFTSSLIARSQGLVPRNRTQRRVLRTDISSIAKSQIEFEKHLAALNQTSEARPRLNWVMRLRESEGKIGEQVGFSTLGELVAARQVRLIAGTRFANDTLQSEIQHGVSVWNAGDIRKGLPSGDISYIDLAQTYGRAVLTEPGDIIFTSAGSPVAVVDTIGTRAVNFPARILRINSTSDSGLHPEILAADIWASQSSQWRRWAVRKVPPDTYQHMRRVLQILEEERQAAARRLELLNSMSSQITNALLSGGLEILIPESFKEGRP